MTVTTPIDVRDMAIIHKTFRSTYAEAAALVRANPTPSPARVTFLSEHIEFGLTMLHHHHESEDSLLYPLLIERAPEAAARVEQVDHEHEAISDAVDAAHAAVKAWREAPSAATGEALATALEDVNTTADPHLDHEENEVVPLAATVLTQEEWEAVGAHSRAAIPRDRMPIAFRMILEPLTRDEQAYMKSSLPAPVKLLFPLLIDRPWKKYAETLRHGT